MQRERDQPPVVFDPSWLFLIAGLALLACTVLISAQASVQEARDVRERVLAVEAHREQRLDRYREFLFALDQQQPALVESLASSQLNQIPAGRAAIPGTVRGNLVDASIFPALEPPPLELPAPHHVDSTLARWISHDRTRLWLMAGSALLILLGLLPASKGWARTAAVNL